MACCSRSFYSFLVCLGSTLQPLLLLAIRLFWGGLFLITGWEKLSHLEQTALYFEHLSIAFPLFMAALVGFIECVGGFLLCIGFASRLAAIPLIVITIVAFLTAHIASFALLSSDPQALVKQPPFDFLLASLLIFAFGPGAISVDGLCKYWCSKKCSTSASPPKQ